MGVVLLGVIIGIATMIILVAKTRVPATPAMLIAMLIIGLFAGMEPTELVTNIQNGFGNTLSSIGIVIALGVIMGSCFEHSGAATRMAKTFVKICGKGREDIALGLTGLIVSIPVFADSAFIILNSLVRAISHTSGKSVVGLGAALGIALLISSTLLPPTPGPLAVAGILGVNLGVFILWGILFSAAMFFLALVYVRKVSKDHFLIPDGDHWITSQADWASVRKLEEVQEHHLPGNFLSFAPIVVPILLIFINTFFGAGDGFVHGVIQLVGTPVVAVGIGVLIAIYGLTRHVKRTEMVDSMDHALASAGLVLVVTGLGGAMGAVLSESGAGAHMADVILSSGVPPLLVPFVIASLLKVMQGSSTAAMIVAATMTAPLVEPLGIDPVFAGMACGVGALSLSHLNDSFYHVVTRNIGLQYLPDQMKVWSLTTTTAWGAGGSLVMLVNLIFGQSGTIIDPIAPLIVLFAIFAVRKYISGRQHRVKPAE
ncbi:gluconate permease [Pseudovibrio japonicus]|uniref:Gluconate permease n=1 Tax=Pseudovibrio japonicus TaxID=366534 RepID=A0ABQ3ELI2_9HYPH|nr:SLC13 family permease [Pseudovibrio japonicus]GHB45735.1 gluconate permease [Pseudovibrio japonicus]